jgi:hypothetical protein
MKLSLNYGVSIVVLAIGLTLASGVIHGRLSHRWSPPEEMLTAAHKLENLPDRFGEWQFQDSLPLEQGVLNMLQCAAYANGSYVNQQTGETVVLTIVLGPPGTIWAHKPDGCYTSREYTVYQPRKRVDFRDDGLPDETFWALTFQSTDIDANLLRVFYAWSEGSAWSAPDEPRFEFGGQPFLFKVQVAGPPGADSGADEPCFRFLQSFLPVARQHLLEPAGK